MFKRYKVKKILDKRDGMDALIHINQILSAIYYRNKKLLSQEESIVVLIEQLEANINVGGFYYFFWGPSGNMANETLEALQIIGSRVYLDIYIRAMGAFPNSKISQDIDYRQRAIKSMDEQELKAYWETLNKEFLSYTEDIHRLVLQYIKTI